MSKVRDTFISAAREMFGNTQTISRQQINQVVEKYGIPSPQWLTGRDEYRIERGLYHFKFQVGQTETKPVAPVMPKFVAPTPAPVVERPADNAAVNLYTTTYVENLVPTKIPNYVEWGNYKTLFQVLKSGIFYPTYVTGPTGNGKTLMVEQICAKLGREYIRANITAETDEDDLIGGFRLVDGKTIFQPGPVVVAMERGAVLLLDEVDLGTAKLMCLQPVLEGKSVLIKKVNRVVTPKPGFNVIATANTKGRGSDDGRYMGTNILNEAFLERFAITLNQEYPPVKVETEILTKELAMFGYNSEEDAKFVKKLVKWSELVRKSYDEGATSEVISTRRLVRIVEAWRIFNRDETTAVTLPLNRFDSESARSLLEFYQKCDEDIVAPVEPETTAGPADPFF